MVKPVIIALGAGVGLVMIGGIAYALYRKNTADDAKKEVYFVGGANTLYTYKKEEAKKVAAKYGGSLATKSQMTTAYLKGAHWYAAGWVLDGGKYSLMLPLQHAIAADPNIGGPGAISLKNPESWPLAGVCVYGVKPTTPLTGDTILHFNTDTTPPTYKMSDYRS